jgi:hypothetical protein
MERTPKNGAESMISPEEKFRFDLEGYLVVKNALAPEEVVELNRMADENYSEDYDEKCVRSRFCISQWGPPFQSLIDHPSALPYLVEFLGTKFRVDHDYIMFMIKGGAHGRIHGGPAMETGFEEDHWYRCHKGVIRNGLMVFTYCLTPAGAGDGGFICVPGSHKSNFVMDIPEEVRLQERDADYVVQPKADAGDLIIFTEALLHGTRAWTADHERRALLYKYSPGHSSWSQNYYRPEDYPEATEQQLRIMAAPSVGSRPDSIQAK